MTADAAGATWPDVPFPEPTTPAGSRAEVFVRYLDYFRSRLAAKLAGLPAGELRTSRLPSGWTPVELLKHTQARRSRAVIDSHELSETGEPGDRWDGDNPATLERILFHLVQEYARHVGHLDVVAELAGGTTGE
jgi:Protein of unknown function (DUF664)